MRKEDRIRNQEPSRQPRERESQQQQRDQRGREDMRGSASTGQTKRPERQSGKLPLPD